MRRTTWILIAVAIVVWAASQAGWLDLIRPGKPGFLLPVAQHPPIHCANKQMTRTPGAAKPL